jgi:transposase InsO family protein
MAAHGIEGATRAKKRFTTKADATHVRAPDLVKRDFTATRPDALWVADFTYCSTWSGIVYVAFIKTLTSRHPQPDADRRCCTSAQAQTGGVLLGRDPTNSECPN